MTEAQKERRRTQSRTYMAGKRAAQKLLPKNITLENPAPYHDKRVCKKCKGPLETSRWLRCLSCLPSLDNEVDDEYIYL